MIRGVGSFTGGAITGTTITATTQFNVSTVGHFSNNGGLAEIGFSTTSGTDPSIRFSSTDIFFRAASASKMTLSATAGSGIDVAAGTAASNAPRALSISQGWTDGTTGNIGIVGNFDMGATGTATGDLLNLQAGAAGTTKVIGINYLGAVNAVAGSAIPAGGTAGLGLTVSSTANFGVFFGSGAPSLSAAKGSLYLRSDGSGVADRAYINTDGSTAWAAIATAS